MVTIAAHTPLYTDKNASLESRVRDLLDRMTVEEKAGLFFHAMITMNPDGTPAEDPSRSPTGTSTTTLTTGLHLNHFNLLGSSSPRAMAVWHNTVQDMAADTRLGIPVTLSTDPRNAFSNNPGTAAASGPFSKWPEALGFGALNDPDAVRVYADIIRQEYVAVGLRVALHPQVDLATEPRWARAEGTFGQDAHIASRLVGPYLEGLRGGTDWGHQSVSGMVKHFPGGGPQKDGEDPHFSYGKDQVYPGGRFEEHLEPFRAAVTAGATQMMPYYGRPVGTGYEPVAFGFNKGIITGLLREQLGFDGIVCTDWSILTDGNIMGEPHEARAWGLEHLSPTERAMKALQAGVDQFGGEHDPELILDLIRHGHIDEERLDVSVARLLREKFRLGLFDDARHVDPDKADEIVGRADFTEVGQAMQSRSMTVLTNTVLPLQGAAKAFLQGIEPPADGTVSVVDDPAQADFAVLRVDTPYEKRPGLFESFFRAGRLDFPLDQRLDILDLAGTVPTIVVVHMDRPAIMPEIIDTAAAVIVEYGASDTAVWDVLQGHVQAQGRLPFELPRSMAAVEASRPDVPSDTVEPVRPFGFGLEIPTS